MTTSNYIAIHKEADITPDGLYRYALRRSWDPAVWPLAFIMLNPSTADTEIDDPTIRRCMGFARRLGYGGITVYNLYAYRATKPADLWKVEDPVGPGNDHWLNACLYSRYMADLPVVAAWGANARPDRVDAVMRMRGAENLCCFGVTKAGAPRHPLYLPGDAELVPWAGAR